MRLERERACVAVGKIQVTRAHDFRSFSDDAADKSTEVVVDTFDVHEDGDLILVHVEGSHFIWKMVRRLVGVLVEVGRGRRPVEWVSEVLSSRDRGRAGPTAPAEGLFLVCVEYEQVVPPLSSAD